MAKGYSKDLRERAVAMVEEGESRREVARLLNLAPSTAVRWLVAQDGQRRGKARHRLSSLIHFKWNPL
jgi:transposase-like protein